MKQSRGQKLRRKEQTGTNLPVPAAVPLLPPDESATLPVEHRNAQSEEYPAHPLFIQDTAKKSHFQNLGLMMCSESHGFRTRSGLLQQPLAVRNTVLKTGALPFSSAPVFAIAERAGKTVSLSDVLSDQRKQEIETGRACIWPDLKFRSRIMTQSSEIPDSDAVFCDLKWVTKRKRVGEIERKRKAEAEELELDKMVKRKKLLSQLKEYPERELRSIFPHFNQQAIVEVEKVKVVSCSHCHLNVYQVENQTLHTCRADHLSQ